MQSIQIRQEVPASVKPEAWRRAMLVLALAAIAFATLASAHWDPQTRTWSPYPVHLDEYFHWGFARASVEQGTIAFGNPFTGGERRQAELSGDLHERGFQAFLGSYQQATGISWLDIFSFGPAAIAVLLALCVFILLEPAGAGVEGALLIGFVPTSLRFLGPGFLVPIAFAMPLVIGGLWWLVHGKGTPAAVFLGIIAIALWPVHAMGALSLSALTLVWLLVSGNVLTAHLARGLIVAVAFLAAWPYYGRLLGGTDVAATLPASLEDVRAMGWAPFVIAAVGAFAVPFAYPRATRALHAMFIIPSLGMMGIIIGRNVFGNVKFNLYDRTVTTMPVFIAITAAIGVAAIIALTRRFTTVKLSHIASVVVSLALAGALVHHAVTMERENRYQVLDDARYHSYLAAASLLPNDGSLALVDGIATMPFSAITGHPTLFVQDPSAGRAPLEIERFFAEGANDTVFLLSSRVQIVVTDRAVINPDLRAVSPGVYVFELATGST